MISVDKKKLDTDTKPIQHIEYFGQLKNVDGVNASGGNAQLIFVLTILDKIKEIQLKFSQGSITVL